MLRYLTSAPTAQAPRPVLCFLHGYDEAAPMEIEQALTRHGPLNPDNPRFIAEQFIIVAPQLPRAGDVWYRHAEEVESIVRKIQQTHNGDAARTYLTGFSFGGNGVFDLGLLKPQLWTALWAVDPTRVPKRDSGLPVWLSAGELARRVKAEFIQALALEQAAAMDSERVLTDELLNHVQTARSAYRDLRIYEWLLAHARMA